MQRNRGRELPEKIQLKIEGIGLSPAQSQRSYRCRFIKAGQVRALGGQPGDLWIEPAALEAACARGLFNHKAVFIDHAGLFDHPSLRNLVGCTAQAVYLPGDPHAAGETEACVEGVIRLYDLPANQAIANLLDEILQAGPAAPDVGLSVVFWVEVDEFFQTAEDPAARNIMGSAGDPGDPGSMAETIGLRRVTAIQHVESVDLVFEPAADGRVLEALSVFSIQPYNQPDSQGGNRMDPQEPETQNPPTSTPQPTSPGQSSPDEWLEALGQTAAQAMISASGLPPASQERLANAHYRLPQEVGSAIESERLYLARLQEDQVVQLGGIPPRASQVGGMRSSLDQVSEALDALLLGRRPANAQPLSGLRELYHLLSGDFEMSGLFHSERVSLANVNSSTMASLVANALNKRLVNEFIQYPQWWSPLVSEEDFASLQAVRWITLGGVGELPTVAEGAAYTELSWDDSYETASFVKKGGYLGLTLEAIDKDDTGRLRAAPRALAQAAWLTLSKALSAIFTDNSGTGPTLSDSLALFHTSHGNLGTTALSLSSYAAARTAMRKQTELNSSERLGALTAPKFLLVPPDLEITALQVLASQFDYTYALSNGTAAPENILAEGNDRQQRLNLARQRVIVVDLWTDTNNWAASADPRLWPTIGIGYRYGRAPEIFSVASPTAGLMFTNDTLPVKVRYFFAVGPMDYRGLYKANV
jgi:hypothetical protein